MTSKESPGPNIGTRVIQDHDRVRIWELVLSPGESSEWHAHQHEYIFVVIEPAPLRTDYDDGTSRVYPAQAGEVVYTPPSTHRVTNVGTTRYRNVIIELKETPRTKGGPPHRRGDR